MFMAFYIEMYKIIQSLIQSIYKRNIACRTGRLAGPALYTRAHKEKSTCSHIIYLCPTAP